MQNTAQRRFFPGAPRYEFLESSSIHNSFPRGVRQLTNQIKSPEETYAIHITSNQAYASKQSA